MHKSGGGGYLNYCPAGPVEIRLGGRHGPKRLFCRRRAFGTFVRCSGEGSAGCPGSRTARIPRSVEETRDRCRLAGEQISGENRIPRREAPGSSPFGNRSFPDRDRAVRRACPDLDPLPRDCWRTASVRGIQHGGRLPGVSGWKSRSPPSLAVSPSGHKCADGVLPGMRSARGRILLSATNTPSCTNQPRPAAEMGGCPPPVSIPIAGCVRQPEAFILSKP